MFPSCKITLGMNKSNGEWPYCENIDSLRLMGAEVIEKDVNQIQVDNKFKIVTTPAFMKNATFYQVFDGIGKMVDEVVKMA
jgi:enhancing lycopene biosynthesis protein 2